MRVQEIPEKGGTYLLLLCQRHKSAHIQVGALGGIEFPSGWYAYVGSARRGLRARVGRHLRVKGKRLHWHIDYLRRRCSIAEVACWTDGTSECDLAGSLTVAGGRPVRGFGCSDCRCCSHLFRFPIEKRPQLDAMTGVPAPHWQTEHRGGT